MAGLYFEQFEAGRVFRPSAFMRRAPKAGAAAA